MKKYVECPICNKKLKHITNSHLKTHNMTIEKFKEKYPDYQMISEETLYKKNTSKYIDYNSESYKEKLKVSNKKAQNKRFDKELGKLTKFEVKCHNCGKIFEVEEREKQFPKKEKYFCSSRCSHIREMSLETKQKLSNSVKQAWENGIYDDVDYGTFGNQKKYWSSKVEREIVSYFKENFPKDEWTSGGRIKIDDVSISRDLYSKKLKICIEYDGIWHFKDIHGQLEKKKYKDKKLEEWCIINNYKLIRIDEDYYNSLNKEEFYDEITKIVYNDNSNIIKIGNRY